MKPKILFWLSNDFTHFCMAYYLQKMYDSDFFAIVDIPERQKNFFEQQKLISFNHMWFTFDHILKNHKTNISYLKSFEEKYNINLWNLAVNERLFYRFNFGKFTTEKILSIVEQECRLFETILDTIKPDFLITKWASRHYHQLLINFCMKKNVKVLQLGQPKIGYKMLISEDPAKIDGVNDFDDISSKNRSFAELRDFLKKFNMTKHQKQFDSRKQSKIGFVKTGIEYLLSNDNVDENHYDYLFGSTKLQNIKIQTISPLQRKSRRKFLENLSSTIPSKPFVYYPLAVDMERNLLINAPFYTNQIEVIRHLSKSLPIDFTLVVKENPAQVSRDWRSIEDYKQIMDIPNVHLVNPNVSYDELLQKCSLVVLIGGTTGFEAAFYGKPTISFSDMIYSILPSVYRVKTLEELPNLMKTALNTKVNADDLDKYLQLIENNSFDFDYLQFLNEFGDIFYREHRMSNVDIPINELQKFLDDHKSILKQLAMEHLKKIEWYNQNGKN